MSNWLARIIDGVIGAARGILTIRIVSVTRQTERENEIYREGFDEGHRIGVLNGKARKIDTALDDYQRSFGDTSDDYKEKDNESWSSHP